MRVRTSVAAACLTGMVMAVSSASLGTAQAGARPRTQEQQGIKEAGQPASPPASDPSSPSASPSPSQPTPEAASPPSPLDGLFKAMSERGISLHDRSEQLTDEQIIALSEVPCIYGAARMFSLQFGDLEWRFLAFQFNSSQERDFFCRAQVLPHDPFLGKGDLVFMTIRPEDQRSPQWVAFAEAVLGDGAERFEFDSKRAGAMLAMSATLDALANQVELYNAREHRYPWTDSASQQWKPLIDGGYLKQAPVNPLSPPGVATRLVVVSRRGETGASVDHRQVGWVWSAADGLLWPAGWDEELWIERGQALAEVRVRRLLGVLRTVAARYQEAHGEFPWKAGDVAAAQWKPLIQAGLLSSPPPNPLSPARVCTRIGEINSPGGTGAGVDPRVVGWVWNSADGRLFAAGSDQ